MACSFKTAVLIFGSIIVLRFGVVVIAHAGVRPEKNLKQWHLNPTKDHETLKKGYTPIKEGVCHTINNDELYIVPAY